MTKIDIKDIQTFQPSPDGSVSSAVYWLQYAVDVLRQTDPDLVWQYRHGLTASMFHLGTILHTATSGDTE